MNRRYFFKFLPLAPVVTAAAIVSESQADEKPNSKNHLTLTVSNDVEYPVRNESMFWTQSYKPTHSIEISVGKDNNLWVKPKNGDWKRVVTE